MEPSMKKAYFSVGYQSRQLLAAEIDAIREALIKHQIHLFIFVDQYRFSPQEQHQMMQQAFRDIADADLLIAEVSEKAIGVGIEIGYAAALQKPVICLRHAGAEHSTTASGTATHSLTYTNAGAIAAVLEPVLAELAPLLVA